jgi:hypothetical protein
VVWKRPQEIFGARCHFFTDSISSNDVVQGALSDCWFISALSVLATRDEMIRGSISNLTDAGRINRENVTGLSKGVYPPLFHPFASKGLYCFRFFKNCAWRYVIIDSMLPFFVREDGTAEYIFARCRDP